MMDKLKQKNPL